MNIMTREQMIEAIYEKVADKTLSFGCYVKNLTHHKYNKAIYCYKWWQKEHFVYQRDNWEIDKWWAWYFDFEIIWHSVMFWDFISYLDETVWQDRLIDWEWKKITEGFDYYQTLKKISILWEHKRKPIEDQSSDCIEFVFDNLNLWKQN